MPKTSAKMLSRNLKDYAAKVALEEWEDSQRYSLNFNYFPQTLTFIQSVANMGWIALEKQDLAFMWSSLYYMHS